MNRAVRVLSLSCFAVVALLSNAAWAGSVQPESGQRARAVVPWKDAFGEPLPFQSDEEIREFMRTADIQLIEELEVGITDPRRVELFKDGITLRAVLRDFDHIHERQRFEREFYNQLRDSFVFDLAAYELARMLGLNNVPPVTLRRVNNVEASLQIWVEDAMVEWDRFEKAIVPPDEMFFQMQRQNMRVFDTIIGNVDRNNGNILYDANWNHWLIDHSRSFLPDADKMPYLDEIEWCSRYMYETLKDFDEDLLLERLSPPLERAHIRAILKRRDKVVERLDALIAERGEAVVLF